ncbi:unnamed protein product [Prunus armeniaca]|uniref:Uncharacterized protein n=1 Tax=Prunus armeniaca TaxID=36596 RepID=A0A6J5UBK6_PRUAR|nr:unnamed protein product [Prunus armeniaca]
METMAVASHVLLQAWNPSYSQHGFRNFASCKLVYKSPWYDHDYFFLLCWPNFLAPQVRLIGRTWPSVGV